MKKIGDITKQSPPDKIPENVIKDLREFSSGGFFLVRFERDGDLVVNEEYDTSLHRLAAERFLQMRVKSMDDIDLVNMISRSDNNTDNEE